MNSKSFLLFFETLIGVSHPVTRTIYALSGGGLMLFKYGVEALVIFLLADAILTPIDFLNPLLTLRTQLLSTGPEWLPWAIYIWSLPFAWVAFSMSVRRAAVAGISPWWGFAVLVPIFNLFVMVTLATLPDAAVSRWQTTPNLRPGNSQFSFFSQFRAVGAGLLIGMVMFSVTIILLESYGLSLFFATPLMMGSVTGFLSNRPSSISWSATVGISIAIILAAESMLLLFALEGLICVVMASPLLIPLGIIGALLGKAIANSTTTTFTQTLGVLLVLPVTAGAEAFHRTLTEYVVLTVVEIDAPPETVWKYIVEFPELPAPEEWFFRCGIACPMRARIDGLGVGAVRHCEFSTGDFVEPITVWDQPRRLAFDVTDQPEPMTELSPYRHIHPPHLEQQSLKSHRGEFRLFELASGRTRLEGRTWYSFDMAPQWYWTLWSDLAIHAIHRRVLRHVQLLSEQETLHEIKDSPEPVPVPMQ